MKDTIGIDISKAHLDAYRAATATQARFDNTAAGLCALKRWIGPDFPELVVYEPTGPYHALLERTFTGQQPLVRVNPLQARRFAEACGTRAKTDAIDARLLAIMGAALDLTPDRPAGEDHRELKELRAARATLVRDRTRLRNRIRTQELAFTRRQSRARLAQIGRQLAALERELSTRLKACPARDRGLAILRSIPGLGEIAATALLVECPELGTLERKRAASLAGLAPMTRQSGQWHGKAAIKGGRKALRDALYMPALAAARHNPDLSRKYQEMIAGGKPAKVALTALMRKLIELANTLIKADRLWAPNAP